ncbi:NPCBM/NEW2 domain-containing protein [Planobispora siamensis]|uniref:Glycosyl hydrolase family 98 putative carbohydrate-binding module domain-containing protein n=1 Tax=Planobispora siamensis TaxID=936338 RepID=A0A8J3WJW6_9ACTN|nr:NPCBM/NEW2 domain-containing protein [Planobispora siamensis]GIH93409.1 hypothetical protein Psi01_40390 [Planobispora siamensis]
MTTENIIDSTENEKNRAHSRGNVWITSATALVTAALTLAGTLAGIYFSPSDLAGRVAPNAAVTSTAVRSVFHTVTATATVTATPEEATEPTVAEPGAAEPSGGAEGDGTTAGAPVHLAELKDAVTARQGSSGPGAHKVNGHSYLHGIGMEIWSADYTAWAEYTLDGSYRTFSATLGLNDELATDSSAEFVISGNGRVLYRKTVKYTQQVKADVDVTGLVKLRLAVTRVGGKTDDHLRGAVFGDATLSR